MIKLPQSITDHFMRSSGERLIREVTKGRIIPKFIYNTDSEGRFLVRLELFDSKKHKSLLHLEGNQAEWEWEGNILLEPQITETMKNISQNINLGEAIFLARHLSTYGDEERRFRVEFRPPHSSAVYLAMEGAGKIAEDIRMHVAPTHPSG